VEVWERAFSAQSLDLARRNRLEESVRNPLASDKNLQHESDSLLSRSAPGTKQTGGLVSKRSAPTKLQYHYNDSPPQASW